MSDWDKFVATMRGRWAEASEVVALFLGMAAGAVAFGVVFGLVRW